jgi:hypothetical protein
MVSVPDLKEKLKCEFCGKKAAKRELSIPSINDGPKSIGSLVEQNTKKYGIKEKKKDGKVMTQFGELDIGRARKAKNKTKYVETGDIN